MNSAILGKESEHLENWELLSVPLPQTLISSIVLCLNFLRERIHCLYSNVNYRLFVAMGQLKNKGSEILHLHARQLFVIRNPNVH